MRGLFTPLLPDDYLELINPLWSTRELRGRIERIKRENDNAVTILIRPGFEWEGHKPGQYLRVGVVVDGVHHWRAYSLTSDPDRPDGWISITPKTVDEGTVSPFFNQNARPGRHRPPRRGRGHVRPARPGAGEAPLHLGGIRDHPDHEHAAAHSRRRRDSRRSPHPLRAARRRRDLRRHAGEDRLRERGLHSSIARRPARTGGSGPKDLDDLCPDWRERETFLSGPGEMIDAFADHFESDSDADPEKLHLERFQPKGGGSEEGKGGKVVFLKSDCETECDGSQPILEAGEEAGLELEHGCRMGICHTCVGKLKSGEVRDMRTGELTGKNGEMVRICINTAEGDVEIEL